MNGISCLVWPCRCDCGNLTKVRGDHLKNKNTSSCGCKARNCIGKTHGLTGSRTYRIWAQMKNRCLNSSNKDYKYYGARGITVCERWRTFENFLEDMGEAPHELTLDRHPNPGGDYEPGNCRWATMKEQNRNRRSHVMLTHEGKTQCLSAWAEELGISETRLRYWIKKSASLETAIQNMEA